jgi:hypothetical protein
MDPISDITVDEGASASTAVSANDPDGDTIMLSASLPGFATLNAPTSGAGSVATTVTANPGFADAGSHPASVTADDGSLTDTANFSINVNNVNRNPVIVAPANVNGAENSPVAVAASASDPDAENVTLSQTNDAAFLAGPASSGPSLNPSINLSGTPGFSDAGSYTVNWSAVDGTTGSANAVTAISIANVDRAVVLAPIADINVAEGASASTPVSATDADGDAISLSLTTGASFASLTDNGDGTGSVSASPGFSDAGS